MTVLERTSVPRGVMGYPVEIVKDPFSAFENAVAGDQPSCRTLYIHIPFCRSRCPFCPFFLEVADGETFHLYSRLLCRELENGADTLGRFPVNAVYFGGGTPTELTPEDFSSIMNVLHSRYRLTNDCEITVEGRVDGFSPEKVDVYAGCGVNRFSIGVQTFRPELRRLLGRVTRGDEIPTLLNRISERNAASVVIDLLYGLPGQTREEWSGDLKILLEETNVSGVDFYHLKSRKNLPLEKSLAGGFLPPLPSQDIAFGMFQEMVERMRDCGSHRLSPMHYALEARERNLNNSISSYKNVCLPFGMKAVGRLGGCRLVQTADFDEYSKLVKSGRKPLASVGILPADFPVNGELSGELYNRLALNPDRIAGIVPEFSDHIRENLEKALAKWVNAGYLFPQRNGWFRMTELAEFSHRPMATDLMEAVAEAWT